MQLITLTTDFGTTDWFVGAMKGVVHDIAPRATVVDLTHNLPLGDLRAGAFALMAAYRFFPHRTVHVAVVDPGVGSARAALGVETADYFFVGPDNGVLSWALAKEEIRSVRRLENEKYFRRPVSCTFHGRDIFAPVAAHLSRGVPLRQLGPGQQDFVRLPWRTPHLGRKGLEGSVMYVDRFGNAITNVANASLCPVDKLEIYSGSKRLCAIEPCYHSVPPGGAVGVPGSAGFLEIAVNGGSAAETLGLATGATVLVRRRRGSGPE